MEEAEFLMEYMEISRFQPVIKCSKCGVAYLTEEVAVEVNKGEKLIEAKF